MDDFLHLQGPLQQLRVFAALLLHKYRTSILIFEKSYVLLYFYRTAGRIRIHQGLLEQMDANPGNPLNLLLERGTLDESILKGSVSRDFRPPFFFMICLANCFIL